mgnify:CR=1 FL=1
MTANSSQLVRRPGAASLLLATLLALCSVATAAAAPRRAKPPRERAAAPAPPERAAEEAPREGAEATDPKEEARKLFRLGIADFDGGYYNRAIDKFKAALKLYPSPKIHTRIALAYKWLGNNLKALEHYELFLKEFTAKPDNEADQQLREQVEKREIARLLRMVAQVKIVMEAPPGAEIRINGRPVGAAPMNQVFRLDPGPVAISAAHKGYYEFKKDLDVKGGKTFDVQVLLVKIKPKVIQKVITIRATPIYKRWWFWTVVGAVVAGGTAGLSAYLSTREIARDPSGERINLDGLNLRW